jgi:hypothetical protein
LKLFQEQSQIAATAKFQTEIRHLRQQEEARVQILNDKKSKVFSYYEALRCVYEATNKSKWPVDIVNIVSKFLNDSGVNFDVEESSEQMKLIEIKEDGMKGDILSVFLASPQPVVEVASDTMDDWGDDNEECNPQTN